MCRKRRTSDATRQRPRGKDLAGIFATNLRIGLRQRLQASCLLIALSSFDGAVVLIASPGSAEEPVSTVPDGYKKVWSDELHLAIASKWRPDL